MDDEMPVRVLNGFAHGAEQREPFSDRAGVRGTVLGERYAFHVLHHEPRCPVGQRVRVVEPGDGGMIQLCQRSLLVREALAPGR